ncbi:hypothetical protein AAE02nite_42320 [Adhaeribacter aerolatus]|uniref:Uncharacterized protein n=1 Tax=Adhaeribacter aerolatus TaxID=670289 RepID=A0A512B3M9_9BACT|nr:hypothetical protein AAE02nite_42320 [Adhaeribacter aerolatus]
MCAQGNNSTPTFNVDLTGDPNGTWTSEELTRRGQLCGASTNDNCVQFNITLDKNAGGLEFVILSGPVPSGSMGYQLECGIQQRVGQPICVDGPGPHKLTLCMPGNAKGSFQIKSIAAFYPAADVSVTKGCTAMLEAPAAFRAATITWKDITGSGQYDKYLSFPNGKANPVITPDADAPAFIDYQVCGTSQTSECATLPYCDVLRVYLHPEPIVTIGPQPAIICPGTNGVLLEGNVIGGNGSFNYIWTDNNGNQVATTKNYLATTAGIYHLEVRTENYPNCKKFSSSIAVVNNLAVNAGPDQQVCSLNNVTLAGTVTGATGGIWSGGAGTFRAGNTALNNVYEPTPAELQQGFVKLSLTSTGNGSCPAVKDEILITFYSVEVSITGPAIICAGSTASLSAQVTGAESPTYAWNNGETTATITGKPAGTYTVTIRDGNSCTVTKSFTITAKAGPSFLGATLKASTCDASNGELKITDVAGGTMPYMYSKDGTNFQSPTAFTGLSAGDYAITVKDANGCTFVRSFTLTNIAGPTAVTATAQATSCKNNDGTLTVGTVTGGTAPYTYAITGSGFQTSTAFTGLAAGTYTVTAKDANGCTITTTVAVGMNIPTSFTNSTTAATCGSNNGQLTVTGVIGGTAPYTYSKDGTTFQTAATFTSLIAGTYTITIKDANGCIISGTVPVNNIAGPSDLAASVKATTCGDSNGELNVTSTTSGTAPYTFSLNGAPFQASDNYTGLTAGTYQVRVKDDNNCIYTEEVVVPNIAGPAFTLTTQSTTCGNSNGSIAIGTVTEGIAPYTYSKDGTNFQSGTAFTALAAGEYTITTKDANGCLATKKITLNNIAGPTNVNLTAAAATCGSSNGTITVGVVTGGTAPYTYSKDGTTFQAGTSFTSLLAGEHTITVKDANGCLTSKKVMISDVAGPTDLTASFKASTCGSSNGELSITSVPGGTAPYTYSKDGTTFQVSASFTALAAGNYTITVKDANGCTFVKTFTINNIAGPTAVTAAAQPATCADNDGTITVGTVTGGTEPYKFAINNGSFQAGVTFTGMASGTYTLTAKDANDCTVTTTVSVGKNIPTGFTSATTASTCGSSNGGFTITGVSGGTAPFTYSLTGGNFSPTTTFTSLAAGTYQVHVKDANNCTYAGTVQVSNIAGPAFTTTTQASTCGNSNGRISISQVNGGTAPYTYSKDGTNFQASLTFDGLKAGEYTMVIKDTNGCLSSKTVQVQDIAGPSSFALIITSTTCGNRNGSIAIGAVTGGTAPYTYAIDNATFQSAATFNAVAAGEHTLTVRDANGCTAVKQVLIENIAGPSDLTASTISSTCGGSNGKLEMTGVTGGTAPYLFSRNGGTYQSAPTFTDLVAGQHTITVKDANGCTYTKSYTISNIAGPTAIAATAQPATCADNDGSITAGEVTGGTTPYQYSIDGINFKPAVLFGGLASGTYTLLAKDANGCLISQPVSVGKVTPTQFSSTTVSSTCGGNDGKITITGITGGTAPYSYSLGGTTFQNNNTFTALNAGAHAVTIKDANGCTYTGQVQVNNTGGPADLVAAVKSTTCGSSNGEINITRVSGGTAPYTYSLDGLIFGSTAVFTGLTKGKYQVSVQDANGCRYTEEVAIVDLAAPTFTATAHNSTCGDSNASIIISNITGGTAPFSFSKDGQNFQSGLTLSGLAAGDYTITAKDANGCVRTVSVNIQNIAGPTGFTLAATSYTCGSNNGQIRVSAIAGGTYPYTYAIDGVNFQTASAFETVFAGEYTVTVKDANGCMVTKKIRVDDIAGPNGLAASVKSTTCGSSNGELTITGVTGGTSPYLYSKDGVTYQAAATFGTLAAGEYAITVKDANGCTFVKTFTLSNLAGPTALAANTQAASCADNDGSISVGSVTGGTAPYTYAINGQDYQASATFSALASGNYTLTVKDANGCTVSAPVIVEKNIPSGFTSNTTATTCGKNNGQVTITAVNGGTVPYIYSLDGTTYQQAATFTALAPGEYQVRIKDAKGCLYTGKVEINSIAAPAFTATAQTATCSNDNGRISIVQVTGGTAPYTYSLDGTPFQAVTSFSNLAAGTYNVTLRDASNCTYTVSVKVENIPGPTNFSLTATTATCGNNNGRISFGRVTGGTAPYSYAIQSSTLSANPFQSSPDFAGVAAGTYTATVKDANGCILQKQVEVGNTAGLANLRATATPSACSSNTGSIIVEAVNGGTTPYTYSVDGVNYQASAYFAALAPKTYTVYVKDATGCSTSANVTVSTNGPQDATLAATPTTCASNSGTLTITAVTGGTQPYTYSINGNTFQTSAQFTNLAVGSYTVTIRDAGGCTLTRTQAVGTMGGANAFTIITTVANCSGTNGQLTISNISGGSSPYTYSINGTTFQNSASFSNLATGDYRVSVKDAGGCVYTQAATITGSQPLAILQVSVTPVGCSQSSGQVLVQNVSGGASPYTYSLDGVNFSASATFNGVQPGKYTLTVKDAGNCSITAAVEVTSVSSSLAQVKDVSCFGATDGEIAIAAIGITDETAYSIDNGVSFHKKAIFSNLTKGIYQVITRFSATCTITIGQVEIKGPEKIRATVTQLTKTSGQENNGSAAVTEIAGGAKPYTYQLDNSGFTPNTEFKNLSGGAHTLLVKDANGCTTSVDFTVEAATGAITDLEIPNGFTPNGDGINDTWAIKNLSQLYPRCKVSVYNRWGNLVFESVGYSWEWDGTYNTQKLPVGTYYYTIKLDDTKPVLRKSVTIMR